MTKHSGEKINELADKWLKGTITPEEKLLLDQWYDTDAEGPLQLDVADASEAEFSNRLLTNIHTRNKFAGQKVQKRWLMPAAAVFLICLSIALYFYQSEDRSAYLQAAKRISPGKNVATLTLADGSKINLNETTNGVIALRNGLQISKTADGRLVYELTNAPGVDTAGNDYHTIESPKGGEWQVKLPDGSSVFLNASTKLTYPTHFKAHERKVHMEGEAYFEIASDKHKPFRVASGGQTVEVLGTHFNIMAYPGDHLIRTTLVEGSVNVKAAGQSKILRPGQQTAFSSKDLQLSHSVDLEEVLSWKNGYFKFDENLESIMRKIARWYNVEVEYESRPDPTLTFSGKISRSRDLSGILKMLAYNGDVHFKVEGRRIIVTK